MLANAKKHVCGNFSRGAAFLKVLGSMKVRIGLTLWIFISSLLALALGMGMSIVGVASILAAIYFWRSSRPAEVKACAVTFLAGVNLMVAAVIPPLFYIGYFVLPKAANAV